MLCAKFHSTSLLSLGGEQNQSSIEFELRWKNRSWNGPQVTRAQSASKIRLSSIYIQTSQSQIMEAMSHNPLTVLQIPELDWVAVYVRYMGSICIPRWGITLRSTVRTSDISWFSVPLLLQNGRTETGHIRRGKCWPRLFCVFSIFQIEDGSKVPTE